MLPLVSWHFPKFQFLVVYTHQWVSQVALVTKLPPANAGDIWDAVLIPGLGRSPGRGHGNPLQYSCLENPMDRGAWWATVHRVAKNQTWLKWLNAHAHTNFITISYIALTIGTILNLLQTIICSFTHWFSLHKNLIKCTWLFPFPRMSRLRF